VFPGKVSYVAAWIAVAAVRMHEILTASSRLQLYDMITRMAPVRNMIIVSTMAKLIPIFILLDLVHYCWRLEQFMHSHIDRTAGYGVMYSVYSLYMGYMYIMWILLWSSTEEGMEKLLHILRRIEPFRIMQYQKVRKIKP
jgi:hypothetical protein